MDMQDSQSTVTAEFAVYPGHVLILEHLDQRVEVNSLATSKAKRQANAQLAPLDSSNDYWVETTQTWPDPGIKMDIPMSYLVHHRQKGHVHILRSGDSPLYSPHWHFKVRSDNRRLSLGGQRITINYVGSSQSNQDTLAIVHCIGYSTDNTFKEGWKLVGFLAAVFSLLTGLACLENPHQLLEHPIALITFIVSLGLTSLSIWLCWPCHGQQEITLNPPV